MNNSNNSAVMEIADREFEAMKPELEELNKEFENMKGKDRKAWGINATPFEAVATARESLYSLLNVKSAGNTESAMNIILGVSPCRTTAGEADIIHPTEKALFIFRKKILAAMYEEK